MLLQENLVHYPKGSMETIDSCCPWSRSAEENLQGQEMEGRESTRSEFEVVGFQSQVPFPADLLIHWTQFLTIVG